MRIENNLIVIEAADVALLSSVTLNALASYIGSNTPPEQVLSDVVNRYIAGAVKSFTEDNLSKLRSLNEAIINADTDILKAQLQSLVDQATSLLGIESEAIPFQAQPVKNFPMSPPILVRP